MLHWSTLLAAVLWAIAMYVYSLAPSIESDRTANKNTVATFLGKNGTLSLCTILYLASSILAASLLGTIAYAIGVVYLVLMRFSFQSKTAAEFLKLYGYFPIVNLVVIIIVTIAIFLQKV